MQSLDVADLGRAFRPRLCWTFLLLFILQAAARDDSFLG